MGTDKAVLRLEEGLQTFAAHSGALLAAAVDPAPALEVGPGVSGLRALTEAKPGEGPLLAALAGRHELEQLGEHGHVLVLATDLPLLTGELLGWLVSRPEQVSVVPVVDGFEQPLCARWSPVAFERALELGAAGERSLRAVFEPDALRADESAWCTVATVPVWTDVDDMVALEQARSWHRANSGRSVGNRSANNRSANNRSAGN